MHFATKLDERTARQASSETQTMAPSITSGRILDAFLAAPSSHRLSQSTGSSGPPQSRTRPQAFTQRSDGPRDGAGDGVEPADPLPQAHALAHPTTMSGTRSQTTRISIS